MSKKWDELDSQKTSDLIGSEYSTKEEDAYCEYLVNEVKNMKMYFEDGLESWGPGALGDYAVSSIKYLGNMNAAIEIVKDNVDITKEASKSLDELNSLLKNLIVKYGKKKEIEEEKNDVLAKWRSEPDMVEDGTDENGNIKYKPNEYKEQLHDKLHELHAKEALLLEEISFIKYMVDAKYEHITQKYSCLSNLSDRLKNTELDYISFSKDGKSIYGKEKLVVMTGKEIKEKLDYYLKDKDGNYIEFTRGLEDDKEYYLTNTKINPVEYAKYVRENGLYQSAGFLGSRCNELTYWYNKDMINGTKTSKNVMANTKSGIITSTYIKYYDDGLDYGKMGNQVNRFSNQRYIEDYYNGDDSSKEVIKDIFTMVSGGRPIGLQVAIRDNSGKIIEGSKHWVSVVGFDAAVTKIEDIRYDNLITLDCANGTFGVNDRQICSVYDGGLEKVVYRTSEYDPLYDEVNTVYSSPSNPPDKIMKAVKGMESVLEDIYYNYEYGNLEKTYGKYYKNRDKAFMFKHEFAAPYNESGVTAENDKIIDKSTGRAVVGDKQNYIESEYDSYYLSRANVMRQNEKL